MEIKFKIGDKVQLNYSAPMMKVESIEYDPSDYTTPTGFLICIWFDGKEKKSDKFHQDTVETWSPSSGPTAYFGGSR